MKRILILAGLVCSLSSSADIFSERHGEVFQATREGPGTIAMVPVVLGVVLLPTAPVMFPLAAALAIVDEGVVSPTVDLICLPWDLSCPQHGFYVRVVDELGIPVGGATISGRWSTGIHCGRLENFVTNDSGEIYKTRLSPNYGIIVESVEIDGRVVLSNANIHIRPTTIEPSSDGRLIYELVIHKEGAKQQ